MAPASQLPTWSPMAVPMREAASAVGLNTPNGMFWMGNSQSASYFTQLLLLLLDSSAMAAESGPVVRWRLGLDGRVASVLITEGLITGTTGNAAKARQQAASGWRCAQHCGTWRSLRLR